METKENDQTIVPFESTTSQSERRVVVFEASRPPYMPKFSRFCPKWEQRMNAIDKLRTRQLENLPETCWRARICMQIEQVVVVNIIIFISISHETFQLDSTQLRDNRLWNERFQVFVQKLILFGESKSRAEPNRSRRLESIWKFCELILHAKYRASLNVVTVIRLYKTPTTTTTTTKMMMTKESQKSQRMRKKRAINRSNV